MAVALRCFRLLPPLLYRSSLAMTRGLPQAPTGCSALLLDGCRQCVHQVLLTRQLATKKGNRGSPFLGILNPSVRCQKFFYPFYLMSWYRPALGRTQLWKSYFA